MHRNNVLLIKVIFNHPDFVQNIFYSDRIWSWTQPPPEKSGQALLKKEGKEFLN